MNYIKRKKLVDKTNNMMILAAVGKDETRPAMLSTVYHCSKLRALCAVDGHKIAIISSMYDDELADKSICIKTYNSNKLDFPKVMRFAVPDNCNSLMVADIPKHLYVKDNARHKANYLYLDLVLERFTLDAPVKNKHIVINAEYIKPFIGRECIEVRYISNKKPIYLMNTEKDYYAIMPIRINKGEK